MTDKNIYGDKIVTPAFIANFPALLEPKPNLNGTLKYSVQMLFEKANQTVLTQMLASVKDLIEQKGWNEKTTVKPFRDGDTLLDKEGNPREALHGYVVVNATSNVKYPPSVVDGTKKPIVNPAEIHSGVEMKAVVTPRTYEMAGKRGVSFMLNAAQKIGEGIEIQGGGFSSGVDMLEPIGQQAADASSMFG